MNNYITNTERAILSSIIFEPKLFSEVVALIDEDDFSVGWREIYSAMLSLNHKGLPIDETFIRREITKHSKSNPDELLIQILATNPFTGEHLNHYIRHLKIDALQRKINELTYSLKDGKLEVIDQIVKYKDRIDEISGVKVLKNDVWGDFAQWDLDLEQLQSLSFEYLIDHFIVKNEITMISARAGTGKSLLAVSLSNMLLNQKSIQRVIYLDADNSLSTISSRGVGELKRKHQDRFMYFCGRSKKEFDHIINKLLQIDLDGCLVVFDSIKNFIKGDRDKNKDVSEAMEIVKSLRNNGATVLILHHQNKKQKDINSNYAGSSAFEEDVSNAFVLERNEDKKALILKPFKARSGELYEIAYRYNQGNTLTQIDLAEAKQSLEDEEMIEETIEFIKGFRGNPMWSELWKNLTEQGYDKEKASNIIKAGVGKLWNFYKGDRNNQKLYYLITHEKVQNDDSVQNSPRTPRTPNIGLYGGAEVIEYTPRTPRTHNIGGLDDDNEAKSELKATENPQNRQNNQPPIKYEAVYI